jgi:hypothetical protein
MKNKNQFNLFSLYQLLIKQVIKDALHNSDSKEKENQIRELLENWLINIDKITYYMLHERFIQAPSKKKEQLNITPDMRRYLIMTNKISVKEKQNTPLLLDVVKYYKLLENYILTRNNRIDEVKDLQLGSFQCIAVTAYDSLPKLLLDVRRLCPELYYGKILTIIFSAICVYRQFQVNPQHSSLTITSEYTGKKSIEQLLRDEFSNNEIDKWLDTIDNIDTMKSYLQLLIYSGNASSPNGGASGINLLNDIAAVSKDQRLLTAIRSLSTCFKGHKEFLTLLDAIILNISIDPEFMKDKYHSRLVTFSAPGGKARVIAIVDW